MPASQRIVFATFGSLGDLHPYIPLARELQRRGHRPVIATFDIYRDNVEAQGLGYAMMRPAADTLGEREALMRLIFDERRGPERLVRDLFMRHIRESYDDLARIAEGADLLVTHPISFAGPLVAEKLALPWASTVLAPLSLMSCIDPPIFGPAPWMKTVRRLGVTPYRMLFGLAKRMTRSWETPLRALRAELGLPPGKPAQFEGQYSPYLNLALFSHLLAEPQADWPARTLVCGFPRHDGPPPDARHQRELDDFLAAGDAPLVFGLGSSAVLIAGDFWQHAIAAARALNRRAILLIGKDPQTLGSLPPGILAFDYLPYSAVFPHAAAVVHQAGIGTLSQALAAGRPQLIVPVAFDQPDNAARTAKLGVARVLPFRRANATTLTRELGALLNAPDCLTAAEKAAALTRNEDAVTTACDALLRIANDGIPARR